MEGPLIGIELKGWYMLSREGVPNFRLDCTPAVCAPQDLLVVVPWAFADVVAGSPRLLPPYVTPVRYAAERRNWHW